MTTNQQHAARLREMADNTMLGSCGTSAQGQIDDQSALLAGAEALEKLEAINTGEAVTHNMMVAAHFDRVETYFTRMDLHCTRAESIYERMAKALEGKAAQGRWRLFRHFGQSYMIPVERSKEWSDWCVNRESGERYAIVPEWAVPVDNNVVITGWER